MAQAEEVVSGIFSLAVVLTVFALIVGTFYIGWDINEISNLITSAAFPFITSLLILFLILSVIEGL